MELKITYGEAVKTLSGIMSDTVVYFSEIQPKTWRKVTSEICNGVSDDSIKIRIAGYNKITGFPVEHDVAITSITQLVDFRKPSQSRYRKLNKLYSELVNILSQDDFVKLFTMDSITKERCKTEDNLADLRRNIRKIGNVTDNLHDFLDLANLMVDMVNKKYAIPDFVIATPAVKGGDGTSVVISRETDNPKENTFDFVKVEIPLALTFVKKEERMKLLDAYGGLIDNFAVRTIRHNPAFKRYGVPVNALKCTNKVYTRDSCLVYTFELKEIGD